MRKQVKSIMKFGMASLALCLFMASCSNDDGNVFDTEPEVTDPTDPTDPTEPEVQVATLIFVEGGSEDEVFTAEASGEVGTSVPGRVIFTTTDLTQRRMYITQNVSGQGEMPFNNFDLDSDDLDKALKGDGSIDLDGATKKEIDFTFDLPVPDIDNGEIVYSFWTTTGKGDFRDATKRQALGVGTITVTIGNGTNPAAEVNTFTDIQLNAPAADGTTETFYSLLDGEVYRINEGREFRNFWDFGYYYGESGVSDGQDASFASTATYDASFGFPVEGLEADEDEENFMTETLNNMYFATSDLSVEDFDGIMLSGDLDNIDVDESDENERINNLEVGDVVQFIDNYGKKGYIKITEIEAGSNVNDFIVFDVKVQPSDSDMD